MTNYFDQFDTQQTQTSPTPNFFDQFDETETEIETRKINEIGLPEAGTYSENDMSEDDNMFSVVEAYMIDRYGKRYVERQSKDNLVDAFLNNRRGVSGGNSVRNLEETRFLNKIQDDPVKMARAGKAYKLYEDMAGLFSKELTVGEKVEGSLDYLRTFLLDPINALGGIVGKAVGGGSVRVASNVGQRAAMEAMKKTAGTGASAKTVKKKGAEAFKKAIREAGKETQKNAARFASELKNTKGFKRLIQKGAVAEIATVASIDAIAAAGTDSLYQNGLIRTGVQEEFSTMQLGIAALGSVIIGGIQAGRVMARGEIGPQASPLVTGGVENRRDILKDLTQDLIKYGEMQIPITKKWEARVADGQELSDLDSDFFIELLLGRHSEDGEEVLFEGISQKAARNNVYWIEESDENVGNWVAEIIATSEQKDVDEFVDAFRKATGNKLRQISANKMTPEKLADTFANKISQSARNLNALKQVADRNSLSIEDLDIETFIATEADLPFKTIKRETDNPEMSGFEKFLELTPDAIVNAQNKTIRLLVSNPSTSALNVIGWGAHTSLNTVSDIALATVYLGKGGLQKLAFMGNRGDNDLRIAKQIMASTLFKGRTILDPSMTRAHFETMLSRNTKAMEALDSTLPGGVENATKLVTDGEFSSTARMLDLKSEQVVDMIQMLSLVKTQDRFTKSVEFVSQMDKALRLQFDKGWDEFYTDPNASKLMQTKEYSRIEALAVERTLETIFSKSYKGKGVLGQIAGVIEDARNIPGIGLMVPFGRFFNNTVDFAFQSSGISLVGKLTGFYKDKTIKELAAKATVGAGFVLYLSQDEDEKRRQGLGLYETRTPGGTIINQQFDYPLSLFKAVARVISMHKAGEKPTEDMLSQISRDFTLGGLLRNLDRSQKDMAELLYHAFRLELEDAQRSAVKVGRGIITQPLNAGTRFLEPLNIVAGIVQGGQQKIIDREQGNKFVNDAFRYFDNIMPIFVGERPELQSAAVGTIIPPATKVFGIRPVELTDTSALLNMLGYSNFELNAERKIREQAPKVANEYNRILFSVIEAKSKALMDNKGFRNAPIESQRSIWDKEKSDAKEAAREIIVLQYSDSHPIHGSVIDLQYDLTRLHSRSDIDKAREELELSEDLGDLNRGQLILLREYFDVKKTIDDIKNNNILRKN